MYCRVLRSIPGLHPPDVNSTTFPSCDNEKYLQTSPNVPLGAKALLAWWTGSLSTRACPSAWVGGVERRRSIKGEDLPGDRRNRAGRKAGASSSSSQRLCLENSITLSPSCFPSSFAPLSSFFPSNSLPSQIGHQIITYQSLLFYFNSINI